MTDIKFIGTNQVELVNSLSENKISPVQSGENFIEFSFDSALSKDSSDYFHFEISGQNVQVSGIITEVHNDYQFFNLFAGCEQITDASQLILSAPTMKKFCYANMFLDCTNLTTPPQIQASTLDQWCYSSMFGNCYSLTAVPVLSATTLADYCYFGMFYNCKALSSAPNLPAQILEDWCYNSMFYNCQNLTSISADFTSWTPSTATTNWVTGIETEGEFYNDNVAYIYGVDNVPESWKDYSKMPLTFKSTGNTTVKIAKSNLSYKKNNEDWTPYSAYSTISLNNNDLVSFSGTNSVICASFVFSGTGTLEVFGNPHSLINWGDLSENCFRGLFENSGWTRTILVDASKLVLPATQLAMNCYTSMFEECRNLTAAPALPAMNLALACYESMFFNCYNLSSVPDLPATGLADYCYHQMFKACAAISTAPALPATTLANHCYHGMFYGCSKLNNINVDFKYWDQFTNQTSDWVNGVSPTGTFYKSTDLPLLTGVDYIPEGWVVVNKDAPDYSTMPLTFKSIGNTNIKINKSNLSYKKNNEDWTPYTANNTINLVNDDVVSFSGTNSVICASFASTAGGKLNVCGNPHSLINWGDLTENCFRALFKNNTIIADASNLVLSANTLTTYCYEGMFEYCYSLTATPQLPATNLAFACYNNMFHNCTALKEAPTLSATTLADYCYCAMFQTCFKLSSVPELLPATELANSCYQGMFNNCSVLTTAPILPATELKTRCYNGMFFGCYQLKSIEVNFTNWSDNLNATQNWVIGVAARGKFTCPSTVTEQFDSSHIPSGWTVINKT